MKKFITTVLCAFAFAFIAFAVPNSSFYYMSDSTVSQYEARLKLYHNTNLELQKKLREMEQEIDSLRQDLNALHAFKQEYVKTKIIESERCLALSFREMDCDSLRNIIELFEKLDEDDAIKELKYKYERKLKQKHRYDSWSNLLGSDLVSHDDIKQMIDSVRQEIDKNNYSNLQQTEMDSVLFAMEHYEDAIRSFKFVIKDITGILEDYRFEINSQPQDVANSEIGAEICRDAIENYFSTNDFKKCEEEIVCVPHLKKQFYEYKRAVLQNPLEHEKLEIEEKILNYKIDGVYE